jgi:hypothetical protein
LLVQKLTPETQAKLAALGSIVVSHS